MLLLLIGGIHNVRRRNTVMWCDMFISIFLKTDVGIQTILRFYPRNLKAFNFGIMNGKQL
jgi:hypothetical protein